jgi:antitoxin component of MazEF toxin-antitoxin module
MHNAHFVIIFVITLFLKGFIMYAVKLTQIGNSYGWILPKEMLGKLKLEKGDCTYFTDAPDGMRITPYKSAAVNLCTIFARHLESWLNNGRSQA